MPDRYAFVLTQIGAEGSAERSRTDQVTKYIVKPACEEKGLDALRPDHDPTPGRITNQIVRHIVESDVVIADLTGTNANVYYELGIAHSFNRPVILLVDDPDMLVFDTKDERVIRLGSFAESLSAEAAEQGKKELRKALDVVLSPGFEPASVVTEAASVRKLDQLAPENPMYKEILALRDDIGSLGAQIARVAAVNLAEVAAFRTFVDRLIDTNQVGPSTLRKLKTRETSPSHNQWVEQMIKQFAIANTRRSSKWEQASQPDDKWGSASADESQHDDPFSDEPPF